MLVNKAANAGESREVDAGELELINRWSRKKLEAKEVYAFAVRLCDNEVDRDGERFPEKTLEELARLFVGKSGIFDHKWSARGQTARIYRTELVREDGVVTEAGDGYRFLKGWAYMLRTEGNRELIAEIEGGIKKEVSVGCAVARAVCSVCGGEAGKCGHEKGAYYNGKQCWSDLVGATDAYEWSFVAVPAQRKAGVIKSAKGVGRMELKEFLKDRGEYAAELELLEREAEAGRRYLSYLRGERCCGWGGCASRRWTLRCAGALRTSWARRSFPPCGTAMKSGWTKNIPPRFSLLTGATAPNRSSGTGRFSFKERSLRHG